MQEHRFIRFISLLAVVIPNVASGIIILGKDEQSD